MSSEGSGNSLKYCRNCYQEGSFTEPELSISEMQQELRLKLTAMGFSEFMVHLLINDVPKLERWRSPARALKNAGEDE